MSAERPSRISISLELSLAVAYAALIFVLGSLPGTPVVARNLSDKVEHCLGFALLAGLWCRALRRLQPGAPSARIAGQSFVISVGLGGALELWQALLVYRSCELLDWVADALGAGLVAAAYLAFAARAGARPRAAE